MQPNRSEMQSMGTPMNGLPRSSKPPTTTVSTQIALHEFHNSNGNPLIQHRNLQRPSSHFDQPSAAPDDFFDQMLFTIPSWPDLTKSHWDLTGGSGRKQVVGDDGLHFTALFDESSVLSARLRQQQISSGGSLVGKPMVVPITSQPQQHQLHLSAMAGSHQSTANASVANSGLFPTLPLSLGGLGSGADPDSSFKSPNATGVGFSKSQLQHFHQPQGASIPQQSFGGSPTQAPSSVIVAGANSRGAAGLTVRPRVRARRGQATDPHSIAERLRRERIAERMKSLQELVPNANRTDKASMLDEIIDYVKFLQLQVKVLSMSRLGGQAAVSPLIADIPPEGRGSSAAAASETISATENLVAKLMEEDMGSAMQYLQGKGLCLMPISLASAISTATSPSAGGRPGILAGGDAPPPSPSMSVLTVQSAVAGSGGDTCVSLSSGKEAASVSKA